MKVLAKEADARWEAKESYLVQPEGLANRLIGQLKAENAETAGTIPQTTVLSQGNIKDSMGSREKQTEEKESPWKAAEKAIDEPEAWSPKAARR